MTITYLIGNSLYVNMTNRCPNSCDFCIRNNGDEVDGSGSLWLEREPSVDETVTDILSHDLAALKELVFCGYGEPLERLDDLAAVAAAVKKACPSLPIRINTNGQAKLIYGDNAVSKLAGLVDVMSISLNAATAQEYQSICHSRYGEAAYASLIDFTRECAAVLPEVIMTVVDVLPESDIEKCAAIAAGAGAKFRVRSLIE